MAIHFAGIAGVYAGSLVFAGIVLGRDDFMTKGIGGAATGGAAAGTFVALRARLSSIKTARAALIWSSSSMALDLVQYVPGMK